MEISIQLYANLRGYAPEDADHYQVDEHTEIMNLLERLGIPGQWCNMLMVFVNNTREPDLSRELRDGDEVKVFFALGGG